MECFIFGLFTLAMSIGQAQAVSSDETQIESWQKQRDSRKPAAPKPSTKPRLPMIHPLAPVGLIGATGSASTTNSSPSLAAHGSTGASASSGVVGTTADVVHVPLPLASNSNAVGGTTAASGQVSISLPVAHPLPPSTTTRARNCRVVFVGSGSTVAAHAQSTNQVFGWLNAARWRSALLPPVVGGTNPAPNRGLFLEWVLTVILFVPGLVLSLFTGNVIRFLLPLDVTHDDYDRLKGYRLPAPGVQTIIDVIDPATRVPPPQQSLQQPPPQQYVQNPYATQNTYQSTSAAPTLSVPQRAAADLELHPIRNASVSRAVDTEEVTIGSEDDGFAK